MSRTPKSWLLAVVAGMLVFFGDAAFTLVSAAGQGNGPSVRLTRGVNIYYTVTEKEGRLVHTDDPLNRITEEDVLRIKNAGFSHVRLALSPYPLMRDDVFDERVWKGENATLYLQSVHALIRLFIDHDIAVVLAVMPSEQSFERIFRTPAYAAEWVRFFQAWGREFSGYPATSLVFETLNEPRFALFLSRDLNIPATTESRYPPELLAQANTLWFALENQLLEALRAEAPQHTLVATADGFSDPLALSLRLPLKDPNIIYGFHYYLPLTFTHQHAKWFVFPSSDIGGIAYPAQISNCQSVARNSPPEHRHTIERYCQGQWGIERHRREMSAVYDWSKRHGVPVWVGEFGTYPLKVDNVSVKNYYRDIQRVATENEFGWCAWEYANWLERLKKFELFKD